MKLNYSHKRTITTADLFDACDPPLSFEVRTRPPKEWANIVSEFSEGGRKDAELAKKVIAGIFLTVASTIYLPDENGELELYPDKENTYPIQTVEQVTELVQAIENENPGYGDEFLRTIAWGIEHNHFTYLSDHLGNSLKPLAQLNGNGLKINQVKVS